MGNMVGKCQTLTLDGSIEKIRASYSRSAGSVTSMKYYKGGASKTYGTLLSNFKEWTFTDTSKLIGLHGYVNGSLIKTIGFITLDTDKDDCPVYYIPEPVADLAIQEEEPEEEEPKVEEPREEPKEEPKKEPEEEPEAET